MCSSDLTRQHCLSVLPLLTRWLQLFFQPVHPSGRYHKNSLIEILVGDFGYEKVYRTFLGADNFMT